MRYAAMLRHYFRLMLFFRAERVLLFSPPHTLLPHALLMFSPRLRMLPFMPMLFRCCCRVYAHACRCLFYAAMPDADTLRHAMLMPRPDFRYCFADDARFRQRRRYAVMLMSPRALFRYSDIFA